jgi:putative membrane protein insertion efficiency factor
MMAALQTVVCQALRGIGRGVNLVLMGLVRGYRLLLSPWLGSACRFSPTCSQYALTALERHGPVAGSYLATRRLLRCHPLCSGGHDPVPEQSPLGPIGRSGLLSRFCQPSSDNPHP